MSFVSLNIVLVSTAAASSSNTRHTYRYNLNFQVTMKFVNTRICTKKHKRKNVDSSANTNTDQLRYTNTVEAFLLG